MVPKVPRKLHRPEIAPRTVWLPPEDARAVREGFEQAERGEFLDLSSEELDHFLDTGELPEHAQRCVDSSK